MSTVEERKQMRECIAALIKVRGEIGYRKGLRLIVSPTLFDHMMRECERGDWGFHKDFFEWRGSPIMTTRRLKGPGPDNWEFVEVYIPTLRSGVRLKDLPMRPVK